MTKNLLLLTSLMFAVLHVQAQTVAEPADSSWTRIYRNSYRRINDLVHTKLEVKFDYEKSYMYGKEWLTLKPHFYPTDSLLLDAKGMDIKEVALFSAAKKTNLKYQYDSLQLKITLDRIYKKNEKYTIYIAYTSKPNELKVKGSAAINDAKGLYFINPKGEDKDKPIQIWTQGETESNSAWMPTIDKPNQKSTEEIYMTVPQKYVTLSNGALISQKKNPDGTRTDYWKMDLPHAPYLFFMGVGDFVIVKDQYKGKEVSYYVEKKYASVARKIFGYTPEMMQFFSQKLGIEYPWNKYAQMVVYDYVSGAMENTTATLHGLYAYQNARDLTDNNGWETTIAHELFHHWFGDLVTAESWSNLTVNESMADFSQTLWMEYKYGKDAGDDENQYGLRNYLSDSAGANKDLVRFRYPDKEDMFDVVSYQKGGRVLQMLRNYVGEEAFFQSLNLYLTTYKFKTGEADQMRLAFEEVTGQDLNWFWNQWYFGSGHPDLKIEYQYDDNVKKATLIVQQMQNTGKIFRLPVAIDIYEGSEKRGTKPGLKIKQTR
ncbi:M1 family metallopeptidase [Dyadobacter sp. NIV53]|uniref:M1 family metallopeptidase n=1 Tax=Dyadobacter sp. NIV53 TaxID=2861765 RepID=UPI001C880B04|nr:M1 family metallopeptidase [Dyadobacter sp. NIV53]